VRHILKPEVFRDRLANERDLRDRLLHAETNLPMGPDRTNPAVISKVLDSHFEGRAQRNHLSVVISVEKCMDPAEYAEGIERVRKAAHAWLKRFAPGSKYVLAVHGDKYHPHVHLVVCNWDPVHRRSITFSRRALIFMNSLDWCPPQVGLIPGAGLYAQAQDFKAPKTKNMRELVNSIRLDPAGRLNDLLKTGKAQLYSYASHPTAKNPTPTVNWGVATEGARFSLAGISYALRQLGAPYGVGKAPGGGWIISTALPKPIRTHLEQQNRAHLAMGIHYGTCSKEEYEEYLYDHDIIAGTSPEEQAEIHAFLYGPNPDSLHSENLKHRIEKVTNAHLKRRLVYGKKSYNGPNRKFVNYLYDPRRQPSPGQRKMGKSLAEQFLAGLTGAYVRRADPWREFLHALGRGIEQLAELAMGPSRDVAL
jgi:hypothetical protein